MTKRRTLAEAAVDVLQSSAKSGQEPMPKVDTSVGAPAAAIVDLGGATHQQPDGGPVGQKASAVRSQMTPPKGPSVGAEGVNKADTSNQPQLKVSAEVQPAMATPSGNAPTANNAHETGIGEEVETEPELTAEEIEAARVARLEGIRATMKSISVDEDVSAMFEGSDLSEEFKTKIKTIFEAAVVAKAVLVVEKMEQEILAAAEESVAEIKEQLEGQVDSYLDHMVSEWMEQNKVAVEAGLKTEITEEFIGGLRDLFVEHNMSIPEEQVSVVEALTAQVEELTGKLNETLNNNVELSKRINEAKKVEVIATVCEGLTATQAEKLKTLAEGVDFTTEGEYKGKLSIIREQYFPKVNSQQVAVTSTVVLNEPSEPTAVLVEEHIAPQMQVYTAALSKVVARGK
jgi:SHS2 domain-containing protein